MLKSVRETGITSFLFIMAAMVGVFTSATLQESGAFEPASTTTVTVSGKASPAYGELELPVAPFPAGVSLPTTSTRPTLTPAFSKHSHVIDQSMVITGSDLAGDAIETYEGWTVVQFWSTWCKSCRVETPNLVKLHKKYGKLGVNFVGISLDKDTAVAGAYLGKHGIDWLQVISTKDGELAWNAPWVKKHQIKSIPAIFLVNPQGRVVEAGMKGFGSINHRLKYHLELK